MLLKKPINLEICFLSMCAKLLQSCPMLCDPMDCSPPGCSVHRFSRQEQWSGLPCHPPGDLPNPGMEHASAVSPTLQVDSLPSEPPGKPSISYKYMLLKVKL